MKNKMLIKSIAAIFIFVSIVWAGTFNCELSSSSNGRINPLTSDMSSSESTIDLGTILWSDSNNGKATVVALPINFNCTTTYDCPTSGLWSKNAIYAPWGNFRIRYSARLSGVKTIAWWSKPNVVSLEVRQGTASGPFLIGATISRPVSSPQTATITTPIYRAWVGPGDRRTYTILVKYDKYDSDGGNDGQCGMQITVIGAAVGN